MSKQSYQYVNLSDIFHVLTFSTNVTCYKVCVGAFFLTVNLITKEIQI